MQKTTRKCFYFKVFRILNVASLSLFIYVYSRWIYLEKHWPVSSQPLALLIIFLLSWGIASSLLPEYVKPNSVITRMLFLFIGAQFCGTLVSFTGLPDMLGMLFWGGVKLFLHNKICFKFSGL